MDASGDGDQSVTIIGEVEQWRVCLVPGVSRPSD